MLEDRERKEKMRDEKEERIRETKIMIALLKKKMHETIKEEKIYMVETKKSSQVVAALAWYVFTHVGLEDAEF